MGIFKCPHGCGSMPSHDCCEGALKAVIEMKSWRIDMLERQRSILYNIIKDLESGDENAKRKAVIAISMGDELWWPRDVKFEDSRTFSKWKPKEERTKYD